MNITQETEVHMRDEELLPLLFEELGMDPGLAARMDVHDPRLQKFCAHARMMLREVRAGQTPNPAEERLALAPLLQWRQARIAAGAPDPFPGNAEEHERGPAHGSIDFGGESPGDFVVTSGNRRMTVKAETLPQGSEPYVDPRGFTIVRAGPSAFAITFADQTLPHAIVAPGGPAGGVRARMDA